jgi:hypothetical protein
MIKFYADAIPKDMLRSINIEMFRAERFNILNDERAADSNYGDSLGMASRPESDKAFQVLTPLIKRDFEPVYGPITEENSYSRIYYNGAKLHRHIDRYGLDITLSLCTYSDIDFDWPLMVEEGDKLHTIVTPPGSAAVLLGTKYFHYRPNLVCKNGQRVIQVFYHWKFDEERP